MTPRILVVDAERELRVWLRHHIEILWPDATVVEMEPQQLQVASAPQTAATSIDLVLLGAQCEESPELATRGLEALRDLLAREEVPPVVLITSGGNELSAVEAIRLGAADYLPRRLLNAQRLASSVRRALRPRPRPQSPPRLRSDSDGAPLTLPQYSIVRRLGESSRAAV